jgi:hypothetical protein
MCVIVVFFLSACSNNAKMCMVISKKKHENVKSNCFEDENLWGLPSSFPYLSDLLYSILRNITSRILFHLL